VTDYVLSQVLLAACNRQVGEAVKKWVGLQNEQDSTSSSDSTSSQDTGLSLTVRSKYQGVQGAVREVFEVTFNVNGILMEMDVWTCGLCVNLCVRMRE